MNRRATNMPIDTRIAARELADAWFEGAIDVGHEPDAVPQQVDAEWIASMGNLYWDRVARSWRHAAGQGRDGYDVLAGAASRLGPRRRLPADPAS